MGKCSIIQDGNELVLSFPYDPAMVADLKSSIPASGGQGVTSAQAKELASSVKYLLGS